MYSTGGASTINQARVGCWMFDLAGELKFVGPLFSLIGLILRIIPDQLHALTSRGGEKKEAPVGENKPAAVVVFDCLATRLIRLRCPRHEVDARSVEHHHFTRSNLRLQHSVIGEAILQRLHRLVHRVCEAFAFLLNDLVQELG